MPQFPVYMDNHATTRVDPRVVEAMLPWFTEKFGNAASVNHAFGWEAADAVDYFKARQAILDAFGAVDFEVDDIQFVPQSTAPLGAEDQEALEKFVDMLDYLEDVQNVYHNAG